MKSKIQTGRIVPPKTKSQCKLYQQVGALAKDLNRLPDAQEIKKDRLRSAPVAMLPMVFLKHRFLPLYEPCEELPEQAKAEPEFFKSLAILSRCYGFTPMDVSGKPYPYNILLAYWDAERQLNQTQQRVELELISDWQNQWQLMTRQTYDTGSTLYYIPVIPLQRMLKSKKLKKAGELLLSVCAYLYHVAGVPYYRDGDFMALSYFYETIAEWVTDDLGSYEEGEQAGIISDINAAAYYGDDMHRRIFNRYNLTALPTRIEQFNAQSPFDRDCLKAAKTSLDLFTKYPDRSVFHNVQALEEDGEEETIVATKYISFVADTEGWLAGEVHDMVNREFQGCMYMQQPSVTQVFDNPDEPLREGLEFESHLFPLMEDLVHLLTNHS